MITKRIIPCLYVKDGKIAEASRCEGADGARSPLELAAYYSEHGADELMFYDVRAAESLHASFLRVLREAAGSVFIPLTVGGGISSLDDFERALSCGADKVCVNASAIENPELIYEASRKYGAQCVVLSVDVKRVDGVYRVFTKGGSVNTGREATEWIRYAAERGAGEVVVNSLDAEAAKNGFDLSLAASACKAANVPVIASGGASCGRDFLSLFSEVPEIDAGLGSTVFHSGTVEISELKKSLRERGVNVRL